MRQLLRIAIPSTISNIAVPLLGLVDTAIVGHLGSAAPIAAVALGTTIVNIAFWLLSFLRMGTGGLTAQAHGAADAGRSLRIGIRALALSALLGGALIIFQEPFFAAAFSMMKATPEVETLARTYVGIVVWGAPAVLALYSAAGWFIGMQDARSPMTIAIAQNVLNVLATLALALGLRLGLAGVALGTVVAQYAALALAAFLFRQRFAPLREKLSWAMTKRALGRSADWGRFFSINRDIFLRTLCLVSVTTAFTAFGTRLGALTLAANALLLQFYMVFSYFVDGLAYAAEAVGGHSAGMRDGDAFRAVSRRVMRLGVLLALAATAIYASLGSSILSLLTSDPTVRQCAATFLPFLVALPLLSFTAFVLDGLYIGATATGAMLAGMAAASATFFALNAALPATNASLWAAFLAFLFVRGAAAAVLYPRVVKKISA